MSNVNKPIYENRYATTVKRMVIGGELDFMVSIPWLVAAIAFHLLGWWGWLTSFCAFIGAVLLLYPVVLVPVLLILGVAVSLIEEL